MHSSLGAPTSFAKASTIFSWSNHPHNLGPMPPGQGKGHSSGGEVREQIGKSGWGRGSLFRPFQLIKGHKSEILAYLVRKDKERGRNTRALETAGYFFGGAFAENCRSLLPK